jgi:hypothetical protein
LEEGEEGVLISSTGGVEGADEAPGVEIWSAEAAGAAVGALVVEASAGEPGTAAEGDAGSAADGTFVSAEAGGVPSAEDVVDWERRFSPGKSAARKSARMKGRAPFLIWPEKYFKSCLSE